MGQLSLATDRRPNVVRRADNVVRFDPRRRTARVHAGAAGRSSLSKKVVVGFPLAHQDSRRIEEAIVQAKAKSSDGNEQRFTAFDYVATAVLILSVFAAPALVWTLLRSASFG
jgi:hypothetical protein